MLTKITFALLLALTSCTSYRPGATRGQASLPRLGILYASTELRQIVAFAPDGAHFGPPLVFVPEFPPDATRYFEPSGGVQCVSIGTPETSDEYAIKRPIRAGDYYQCLNTSFRVVRCFEECRAAIIQREMRLVSGRTRRSSMYVNNCLGVVAFSDTEDMAEGIPFGALLLRGDVGILADPHYPDCRSF